MKPLIATSLLMAAACAPLDAQTILHEVTGTASDELLGASVTLIGDLDGDGCDEFAVGATGAGQIFGAVGCNCVKVFHGKSGALWHTWLAPGIIGGYGNDLAPAGDVNGDGIPDVFVAASGYRMVEVRSGATGQVLLTIPAPPAAQGGFGRAIDPVDDIDGDGIVDLVVGAPAAGAGTEWAGVLSGASGQVLFGFNDGSPGGPFTAALGTSVAGLGDVDGDGVSDVAIGDPGDQFNQHGRVAIYSGATGGLVRVHLDPYPPPFIVVSYGLHLSRAGDANGDGLDDYLIATPNVLFSTLSEGVIDLHSGFDGSLIWQVKAGSNDRLVGPVVSIDDVDCDGLSDLANYATASSNFQHRISVRSLAGGQVITSVPVSKPPSGNIALVTLAGGGDVNGDGFGDVIYGSLPQIQSVPGVAQVFSGWDGPISSLGNGCAGSGGFVPVFTLRSCGASGTSYLFAISDGLGGSTGFIFYSLASGSAPMGFGCTLNLGPLIPLVVALPLGGAGPGQGSIEIPGSIPAGLMSFDLYHQVFVADPGVPAGFSNSKAVKIAFP